MLLSVSLYHGVCPNQLNRETFLLHSSQRARYLTAFLQAVFVSYSLIWLKGYWKKKKTTREPYFLPFRTLKVIRSLPKKFFPLLLSVNQLWLHCLSETFITTSLKFHKV